MNIRTVFMGSPDFAIPILRRLSAETKVVGVVTQPDREAGRGRQITPPPVKQVAQALNIPLIQPARLREPAALQQLSDWAPDLIVVAAFGQILRSAVLELPRFGCINVHGSLLPRWRGAAPIQAAILNGDQGTGISIMLMDPGIDTGPVLSQRSLPILPDDSGETLAQRMAELGADLLAETLPPYLTGELKPQPQPQEGATYAVMLKKEDGLLDFHLPAETLARRVRGLLPWPGAYMEWQGQALKIVRAHATAGGPGPGILSVHQGVPAVGCHTGLLILDEVQLAGKKAMPGKVFLNGARTWAKHP
jgi:methionyl-tRNA formyltransferase